MASKYTVEVHSRQGVRAGDHRTVDTRRTGETGAVRRTLILAGLLPGCWSMLQPRWNSGYDGEPVIGDGCVHVRERQHEYHE